MIAPTDVWLSAPGFRTAHLARGGTVERPLTVCGRVLRKATEAPVGVACCHYCAHPSGRMSNADKTARVFARAQERT